MFCSYEAAFRTEGMLEDSGVFMALQSPGRAGPCGGSLACPHLACTVTPISHLIYSYICAPLWSRAITLSGVSVMLTFHIQPAEAFSLYRDRYYTCVINPAVCVAACLQDGLSWSTFMNVSASENNLWGQGLCVYLYGLCLCGFRVERQKQLSVQLISWFVPSLCPYEISEIKEFKKRPQAVFISQTFIIIIKKWFLSK